MNWRTIAIGILIVMSLIDLSATYYYVNKYKKWQPEKPYNMIELNPMLVFLWNNIGFVLGTIVGGILILTLIYIIAKTSHIILVIALFLFLGFALFNHHTNINLLHKLIEMYPSGYLPVEKFGEVIGNNLI